MPKKKVEKKVVKKANITLVSSKLVLCEDGEQRVKNTYSDKSISYSSI